MKNLFFIAVFFLCTSISWAQIGDSLFTSSVNDLMQMGVAKKSEEVMTAAKKVQKVEEVPASVVIISRDEIKKMGYQNLEEILENVPGLYVLNNYSWTGTTLGVRGYATQFQSHAIILVDGVNQFSEYHGDYEIEKINMPVEAIERIEIIRGPMSVLYGSGAFFGAINIITGQKNDSHKTISSVFNAGIGNDGAKKAYFQSSANVSGISYTINAGISDLYGINRPLSDLISNQSFLNTLDEKDKITGGKLEKGRKSFLFSGKIKNLYLNYQYFENKDEVYTVLMSYRNGSPKIHTSNNVLLGYLFKFNNWLIDTKLSYLNQRRNIDYSYDKNIIPINLNDHNTKAYEFEMNAHYSNARNFEFLAGINQHSAFYWKEYDVLPAFGGAWNHALGSLSDGEKLTTRSVYTQADYSLFKNLKLTAGVRFEQRLKFRGRYWVQPADQSFLYDNEKIFIIPRFAAIFSPNENHNFKFLFGEALKHPALIEIMDAAAQTTTVVSAPLVPEKIQTFEIAYSGKFGEKLALETNIFRNYLSNIIIRNFYLDQNGQTATYSSNTGEVTTNGIEISLKAKPFKNFDAQLSTTLQNSKNEADSYKNVRLPYSPEVLAYVNFSYQINMKKGIKKLFLSSNLNFLDKMETDWDLAKTDGQGNILQQVGMPPGGRSGIASRSVIFWGANIRAESVFFRALHLSFRCSNILDTFYQYPLYGPLPAQIDKGMPAPGRRFLFTVEYNF